MRIDALRGDLGTAVRAFVARPGVVLLTVLTLSLGIGASTAMFSVVHSVLLKPLPYPEPDRLVSVYPAWPAMQGHPTLGQMADRGTWSWPEFFGMAENQQVFEEFAAYEPRGLTLTGDGPAQRVSGARATWQLFPMLGAVPHVGRLLHEDDRSDSRVVLVSHGVWRDRFGGDPALVGSTITLDDESHEVVGVLPAGFEVAGARQVDFWRPMTGTFTQVDLGNHGGTRAVARLADGVTIERARDEVTRIFGALLPAGHGEHTASVFPRQKDETRQARPVILVMLAASVLLLLVACGNAAAFLLGAGMDRERELAVRGAVGASRARLASQLLVESALLAGVAVVGGVLAAWGLSDLMLVIAPSAVPGLDRAAIDGAVLAFTAATAVAFGIGFGMIPALSLSNIDLAGAMGSGRTTSARRARLQSAVVVGELALAAMLAVTGILLARTVGALDRVDPGFDHESLLAVAVATPFQRFRDVQGETDEEAVAAYTQTLQDELASIPGVTAVVGTSVPPLSNWRANNDVTPENWDPAQAPPIAERRFVTHGFFAATGIDIVEGRAFTAEDEADGAPRVVVISEGLAALGWPDKSPIGRPLQYWGREATVVGVARNVRDESLEDVTELAFYAPGSGGPFLLRTEGDAAGLVPAVRDRIRGFDANLPILLSSSVEEMATQAVAEERYRARLMAVFAGLAGVLALLGIYGVTARAVSRRTREIGIRVALGAKQRRVWRMVSTQAVRLAVFGGVLGVLGARVSASLIETFLWGVGADDTVTFVAVLVGLPLLAVVAASVPARRATRVDPLEALRAE